MRTLPRKFRRLTTGATFGFVALLWAPAAQAQINYTSFDLRTANDVAVNQSGALWAIGATLSPNGVIQRLVGTNLVAQPGSATRVAVEPSGSAWVVNSSGGLFHWEAIPGAADGWVASSLSALDVAVGANGAVWAVGTDHRIMALRNGAWEAISGGGDRISVDPQGNPWVVNSANEIWRWTGNTWVLMPGKARDITIAPDGTAFVVGMNPAPGGFQIWRLAGNTWTEIPGASGVAVAATDHMLSIAQTAASTPVTVSIALPVLTQPQQPSAPIILNGTTSIPVGPGLPVAAPVAPAAPIPASTRELRRVFPLGQSYEAKMLKAVRYGMYPNRITLGGQPMLASSLPPLDLGFAQLAMLGAEAYYTTTQPQITADEAVIRIQTDPTARRAVIGYMGVLLAGKMMDKSRDPVTVALRQWSTDLYRSQRITAAKASLDQYLAWKADPCGYEGLPARQCQTMANLFTTRTPPQDMIALKALGTVLGNQSAEVASATAVVAGALTTAVAGAALTAALSTVVVAGTTTASGIVIGQVTGSLFAAFGGTGGAAAGGAGAIGGAWAGVAAAPIAAAVMIVVVGTMEGIKVVEAMRVEPMLRLKLGAAMTENIVIENALTDSDARNFFFLAFENSAANQFAIPVNNVPGEVQFFDQAGYVSRFKLAYNLNGTPQSSVTQNLSAGNGANFAIPAAATSIVASGEWFDGINWKPLFTRSLPRPTYIGFTSYGTIFSPQVKDEYPEISNIIAKPKELTFTQGGGYVARIKVSYTQGGRNVDVVDDSNASAGWRRVFTIPADATNIHLQSWTRTGLVWEPWKAIIDKSYPSPPNECIKVYGTTLDPKWNNECR